MVVLFFPLLLNNNPRKQQPALLKQNVAMYGEKVIGGKININTQ